MRDTFLLERICPWKAWIGMSSSRPGNTSGSYKNEVGMERKARTECGLGGGLSSSSCRKGWRTLYVQPHEIMALDQNNRNEF